MVLAVLPVLTTPPTVRGQPAESSRPTPLNIARQVSVRVLLPESSGSGAIVDRTGDRYTVVTNQHVVAGADTARILTADGQTHLASVRPASGRDNLDVAWLTFRSSRPYTVANWGDSRDLVVGDRVYAAGFPIWAIEYQGDRPTVAENTRDWGVRAFRFTEGTLDAIGDRPFYGGYQLGYSNDIASGMSGGPVLNASGELVGLNGMLKYPFLGRRAFVFEDGSLPTPAQFQQMETLSWAVPSHRLTRPTSPTSLPSKQPSTFPMF